MLELYIDFDGVILDTIGLLYGAAEDAGTSNNDREFFSRFDFNKILKDEYIIEDSIGCIDRLIKSGKFNISILTHINSLDEGIKKTLYLRRFFSDITIILVPKEISKTKMVHTMGSILVDDYAGNLREWESEGGISIRFNTENEDKGFKTISRLDELLELF
ncbi:MAG: hypothetical protein RSD00_02125 [Bacilli bacterium]